MAGGKELDRVAPVLVERDQLGREANLLAPPRPVQRLDAHGVTGRDERPVLPGHDDRVHPPQLAQTGRALLRDEL